MVETGKHDHTVIYLSHGAGPLPVLGDAGHVEMVEVLKRLAADIEKPSAIVVASAHWEEPVPAVIGEGPSSLYYDYYGFPEESYELQYPARGDAALAASIGEALGRSGIECRAEETRGFDHGLFIPLLLMYPEADIPCVQLSLIKGLNPIAHLAMGEALSLLDVDNLLIIGSGFSFHNMRAFFQPDTPDTRQWNTSFDDWLVKTCADPALGYPAMKQRLLQWESAPHARYCHPREEHLLPLHVCCGAAGRPCDEHFGLDIIGKRASMFLWR